ncbi:MAG TPA: hypothetical protein VNT30_22700 [Stellaceae bacterium]|nr:hypothetical protein [Stellaceae bacterium]
MPTPMVLVADRAIPIDAGVPIDPGMVLCLGGMDGGTTQDDRSGGTSKAIGHDACCLGSCLSALGGLPPPPHAQLTYLPTPLGHLPIIATAAPSNRRYSSAAQPRAPPQTA